MAEGQRIGWQGPDGASTGAVTDPYGEAWLGPAEGPAVPSGGEARARLAVALPAGRYVVPVEAVAVTEPTVLGVATAVPEVQ